ncbi:MAG: DUF480 domain-containing protein [Thermoanaerobaculia bacterium]
MAYTRPLDPIELRILGALMEKERTTPEQYPLSVNALLQACNQKTSREPVTELTETEVVEALDRLRADALVFRVHSSRTERYEHCLDRRWHLDTAGAAAILPLLLLRGAQTVNELRTRCARLHPFASSEEVEATLARLASGPDALVRELGRQPGQRETRWIHLAGTAAVERAMSLGPGAADSHPERPLRRELDSTAAAAREARRDDGEREDDRRDPIDRSDRVDRIDQIDRIDRLEAAVEELRAALSELTARLGD